jgi:branched-chain amino acid aminotransferase
MSGALAWLDGRLVPADEPALLVGDRAFQLGDGIFETLRARRGVPIDWDAHMARLHESADALAIRLRFTEDELLAGLRSLLAAAGLDARGRPASTGEPGDAAVRVTISRGTTMGRGLLPPGWRDMAATAAINAWPHRPAPPELLETGVAAIVSRIRHDPASPLAGVKSTSRADHVYARLEAERQGAADAVILTLDGRLSETTTANLWLVEDDRIRTPGPGAAILAGTARAWILANGAALDLGIATVAEDDLTLPDLLAADEAFLSSSVAGIVPLTSLDGQAIGSGRPGPVALGLRLARERWIDERSLAG